MTLLVLFIFLLGLCIGSFLNVVVYRYNTGRSVATGRSRCGSCGKTLAWYELIPVLSYVIQRGKCRTCGAPLSAQYPLVEIATGMIFVALFRQAMLMTLNVQSMLAIFVYTAVIASILIVICVYDLKHKIIPDFFAYLFAALSLIGSFYMNPTLMTFLAGPAVALPLLLIWLVSSGKWMGFGDVKLALGIGWFLGMSQGFAALILAFWIGALIGIIILLFQRGHIHMKSEIPFAPFLIIGIAVVFFQGITIVDLLQIFAFTQ